VPLLPDQYKCTSASAMRRRTDRRPDRLDHARLTTFHNGSESRSGGKAVSDPNHDVDNGYALSLNLAIFVGKEMQKFRKGAGWDITPYQGNNAWILPIPATFVVGRDSIIRARFVDPDYRKRMAIDIIVDTLSACWG
jgi:hypothetical protein